VRPAYVPDEGILDDYGVALPRTDKGRPDLSRDLADSLVLPRHTARGAREKPPAGCQEVYVPPNATAAWLSAQRHVVTSEKGTPRGHSARFELAKLIAARSLVIYYDPSDDCPVRIGLDRPITEGELTDCFLRAGYHHKPPSNRAGIALATSALFTETSKMGCFSFNLPPGPPSLGGSCPAAALSFMYGPMGDLVKAQKAKRDQRITIDPATSICSGCFACKNAYGKTHVMAAIEVRHALVTRLLPNETRKTPQRVDGVLCIGAEDYRQIHNSLRASAKRYPRFEEVVKQAKRAGALQQTAFRLSDVLLMGLRASIEKLEARRAKLDAFGYTVADYKASEQMANWLAKQEEERRNLRSTSDAIANLRAAPPPSKPVRKKLFSPWQIPDPRYFRIHDSGDLFADSYAKAWFRVCEQMEGVVKFWAPTRVWAVKGVLREDTWRQVPSNLALRPSALHFREQAPTQEYLASLGLPIYIAGKGGGLSAATGALPSSDVPEGAFECPAYRHWREGGGSIRLDPKTQTPLGGTCALARGPQNEDGCRACWPGDYHGCVVYYHEH